MIAALYVHTGGVYFGLLKGQSIPDPNVTITSNVRIYQRVDGLFIIFDKRDELGCDYETFESVNEASAVARKRYAHEVEVRGPAKMSSNDEELFAGMARAMKNGFAPHEPAEDVRKEAPIMLRASDQMPTAIESRAHEKQSAGVVGVSKGVSVDASPRECPHDGMCDDDCACSCHEVPR